MLPGPPALGPPVSWFLGLWLAARVSANWRDHMPEATIPPLDEINANPEFRAKEITKAEFEVVWREALHADIG